MRAWTLRIRKVDKNIFNRIKSGEKTIETRALNTPEAYKAHYGKIETGDKINFLCDGEKLIKTVTKVRKYSDFNKYLRTEDLENIVGKGANTESVKALHYSFPGYEERLKIYGIVAFEFE